MERIRKILEGFKDREDYRIDIYGGDGGEGFGFGMKADRMKRALNRLAADIEEGILEISEVRSEDEGLSFTVHNEVEDLKAIYFIRGVKYNGKNSPYLVEGVEYVNIL